MNRLMTGIRGAATRALQSIDFLETAKHIRDLYCVNSLQHTLSSSGFSQHQFVVSANSLGLCNRIKCLASSMRLADRLSRTIALSWSPNENCCCQFSDLFENEIFELRDDELNALLNRPHMFGINQWYLIDTWLLLTLPNELPENFSRAYKSITGKTIDHEYDRIPLAIRNNYLTYLNALVPVRFVRNEVEDFASHFDDKTISVSVRSWSDCKNRSELFSLKNVYRVLDKEEGSSFFVGCDSEEVLSHIKRRYGRRVISYPHRVRLDDSRLSRIGMQEALIDLLLLSKNDRLKASAYSTFPEMAWWFGGCKANVECFDNGVSGQGPYDAYIEDLGRLIPGDVLERAAASAAGGSL